MIRNIILNNSRNLPGSAPEVEAECATSCELERRGRLCFAFHATTILSNSKDLQPKVSLADFGSLDSTQ